MKSHRTENDKVDNKKISNMKDWSQTMNNLHSGLSNLLALNKDITQQQDNISSRINFEKSQFEIWGKEANDRTESQQQLLQNQNSLKLQITNIDQQIQFLLQQKKQKQTELNTLEQNINANKQMVNNYNSLKQKWLSTLGDRLTHIQQIQPFLSVIKTITERYNDSITSLRNEVKSFECYWRNWTNSDVLCWFQNIENGRFNNSKYHRFMGHIITDNIKGKDIIKINDATLQMFGIENDMDRHCILQNFNRLKTAQNHNVNLLIQAIELLKKEEPRKNQNSNSLN